MSNYENILKHLNLKQVIKFKSLDINFDEVLGLEIPYNNYIEVPANIIPIASYLGDFSLLAVYLKNLDKKELVFVDYSSSEDKVFEIALNEEQFIYYIIRRAMLDYWDEETSKEIKLICDTFSVNNYLEIMDMEDEEFLNLDIFKPKAPLYLSSKKEGLS